MLLHIHIHICVIFLKYIGLRYLHEECPLAALIHDDLNPEQILLNAERDRAFITDFNLANTIPPGSRYGVRRYWWPKGGSWKYFAPEKVHLKEKEVMKKKK